MKKYWSIIRRNRVILGILIIILSLLAGYLIYIRNNQVLPQAAIGFLDDVKLPQNGQKVLVFSPHPDDETIGAGGYIYDSEKNGAEVKIVLVTNGNKHHLEDRRYQEFRQAASILGVKEENLIFLGYPDGHLTDENKEVLVQQFQKIIDEAAPDIIIYPSERDSHPDHSFTGQIVETVLSQESSQRLAYAYLVHHRHWPQPKKMALNLYILPPMKLINFDDSWEKLILDQETSRKKFEAVSAYKSQLRVPILRSLILSQVRANELFAIENSQ